ncbi:MAG: hypothetical protein LBO00_01760 [Zoogloeaceae bacterium]|jgi:hypothetical protein|nr:hypothetical protein [Zoogloeaceae bacterium]
MTTEIERRIVTALVNALIGAGYRLCVSDLEEEERNLIPILSDAKAVLNGMFDRDEECLILFREGSDPVAGIRLVYGNGSDVVSDLTDMPEIVAIVDQVMEDLEAAP